ncbi:hypothetical protein OJF2_33330 [Aquisphaera giovannonii]|uniref:Uncharacterized protein n=1 Tax=Aquisphaera giovannonii TaxID=406548 RepID=A0A5B9W3V2_9BACT|nr:hypothetical protein [Aquisphaera giovannonii]QEH34791.1 hypothetical protein OJF2_33330 [Aquisphaera giovannonii]
MRRRAFIPDPPGRLEGRALLSGAAGAAHGPVALSGIGLGVTLSRVRADFEEFSASGDLSRLKTQLQQLAGGIPFGKVDGLGERINAILARMQQDIVVGKPHPVARAHQGVASAIKADVKARIADGSVHVKD